MPSRTSSYYCFFIILLLEEILINGVDQFPVGTLESPQEPIANLI